MASGEYLLAPLGISRLSPEGKTGDEGTTVCLLKTQANCSSSSTNGVTGIHGELLGEPRGLTISIVCLRLLVSLPVFAQHISPVKIASAYHNAGVLYRNM